MSFFEETQENQNVSVEQFDGICKATFEQRLVCEEIEAKLSEENKKLEELKNKLVKLLEATNRDSWKSPYGTVSRVERTSITMPKDPESKEKFFAYLKNKGIFENLITIHSQTLNSWYKQEKEVAESEGNFHFKVEGLPEPKTTYTLSMRKS